MMIQSTNLNVPHQVDFTNGMHRAIADVPKAKGGEGQGFGPHELLEAALATCLSITVEMSAAKHGMPLTGVTSEVRIDRSNPDEVVLNYSLKFEGSLTEEQTAHLRRAAANCPVAKTLTGKLACSPANEKG